MLTSALLIPGPGASAWAEGAAPDATFTLTTPLSSNPEMARRLLTPLTAAELPKRLARAGKALAEQPVDPGHERFAVHVPPTEPPGGYGLLVFVAPWPEATVPSSWVGVLDRFGIIFVSAARSGNDQSVLGRREPLALLAAANVLTRYRIDPDRVYVGGLSGGSRVALRLARRAPVH